MKFLNILKKIMMGVLAVGILLTTTQTVYCTNYTSLEEYMQESNKQAEAAGYKTINTPSGTTPSLSGENSNNTSIPQTEQNNSSTTSSKPVKTCEHAYVDSIIKEPTCAEPGMMESKCSKCGDTYKTEISPTGKHDYASEVTKEATCTEKGETTYTCTVCGDSYTEEIAPKGHSYVSSVTKEATCTESGVNTFTCTNCGDSYTEEIPATGHAQTVEEVTKEAGMFSTGEKVIKCSACGEILSTEVIPAKYPISYLYIGIAILVALAIAAFAIFRSKKSSFKGERKTA
ncbi:MAG: hypothetical protein J5959_02830 [Butyrivibrio sp.]|nr:hypothetical protein [Butyrivibrio sp.]